MEVKVELLKEKPTQVSSYDNDIFVYERKGIAYLITLNNEKKERIAEVLYNPSYKDKVRYIHKTLFGVKVIDTELEVEEKTTLKRIKSMSYYKEVMNIAKKTIDDLRR